MHSIGKQNPAHLLVSWSIARRSRIEDIRFQQGLSLNLFPSPILSNSLKSDIPLKASGLSIPTIQLTDQPCVIDHIQISGPQGQYMVLGSP